MVSTNHFKTRTSRFLEKTVSKMHQIYSKGKQLSKKNLYLKLVFIQKPLRIVHSTFWNFIVQSTVASSGNSRRSYDSRRSGGSYGNDEKESHKIFDVRNVKLENIRLEQHGRAVHVKVSQELDERRNNGCSERRVTYIHELPRSAIPSTVRHSYSALKNCGPTASIWSLLRFLEWNLRPKNRFQNCLSGLPFRLVIQSSRFKEYTLITQTVFC